MPIVGGTAGAVVLVIIIVIGSLIYRYIKIEPPRGNTNNVVSEQVRHKPTCTVTEAG